MSIAYCARRKKVKDQEMKCLRDRLEVAGSCEEVGELKDRLRELQDQKLAGIAVRAWCSKDLQDEKCTAYFFDRIRQRRNKNSVTSVKNSIGELIKDEEGILEVYRAFYKELYTKHKGSSDGLDWLLANSSSDSSQLSSEEECEGSGVVTFETDKMKHVLSQMSVNKSPGPDGLPVEFYKIFFED